MEAERLNRERREMENAYREETGGNTGGAGGGGGVQNSPPRARPTAREAATNDQRDSSTVEMMISNPNSVEPPSSSLIKTSSANTPVEAMTGLGSIDQIKGSFSLGANGEAITHEEEAKRVAQAKHDSWKEEVEM